MTMIPMNVRLPEEVFWGLTGVAEPMGMTVPQYLAYMSEKLARIAHDPTADEVARRVVDGYADWEIARDLNLTNNDVAVRRRKYGLPSNRISRHRKDTKKRKRA